MRRVSWLCLVVSVFVPSSPLLADIVRWNDGTVIPGTEGIVAAPGVQLTDLTLRYAALSGADLTEANLAKSDLSRARLLDATLVNANLSGAIFDEADLKGADLTGARIDGATFTVIGDVDVNQAQIYSTASYQAKQMPGITFKSSDLRGWNFSGHDLRDATFSSSNLDDANFSGAHLERAVFDFARLVQVDFTGADLTSAVLAATVGRSVFRDAILNHANLSGVHWAESDLSGAYIAGVTLESATRRGFTKEMLYSTRSYAEKSLAEIDFSNCTFVGWSFEDQNLSDSSFWRTEFTDVNLRGVNLQNSDLSFVKVAGTDLRFSDLRGSDLFGSDLSDLPESDLRSAITTDGVTKGLSLLDGETLVVRNHMRDSVLGPRPIPILIKDRFQVSGDGTLRFEFDSNVWNSLTSFGLDIPVTRDGALELAFQDDVDVAAQVGRTFQLFDWTGVEPTGEFAIRSDYRWDVSRLYTTGEVTLTAVPEPSTYVMSLVGVGAMGMATRMRRRL